MSALLRVIRSNPQRVVLIAIGAGISAFALRAVWRHFSPRRKGIPGSTVASWKLSERCEIDPRSLTYVIESLERLLSELELQKFRSEICRGKYDLIASIISRLKSVCSDLQKYMTDDFTGRVSIEEIAKSFWNKKTTTRTGTLSVLSDDSFMSACDEFIVGPTIEPVSGINLELLELYNMGLQAFESNEIVYRKSRVEFCGCDSEKEFAAKLFGLRQAFNRVMEDQHIVQRLIKSGRTIIAGLLRHDKHDPSEFYAVYDRMISYISDITNNITMQEELRSRRVAVTNLWDVLFDLIILDAFEDLQRPPSSIMALVNNSFISRSMKESTINNLIWSLIKYKRTRLQIKDGFISHFYDISQILTCSLTMGLLGGSSKEFQDICVNFKENIFAFVADIFNMNKVRYTTVDELADDVKKLFVERIENMQVMLNSELIPM